MASTFPLVLDSIATNKTNNTPDQDDHPAHHNLLADAVNKIEVEIREKFFNVKHYGAKGDGTTDDSASIQAAITSATAAGGGTVYLPRGTYKLNTTSTLSPPGDGVAFVLASNITLAGAGRQATVLLVYPDNTSAIHLAYGASDITICDLTCDLRNVANGETDGIKVVNNSRIHVQNVEVRGGRIGFQVIKSTDVQYVNCVARDQRRSAGSGTSAGFSCAENVTYNGGSRIQYTNCISLNSDDFGFTIVGASSGNIIKDVSLVNCLAFQSGFATPGVHTASTAGYAFQATNAEVSMVNCTADAAYEFGFILQAATHSSQLTSCRALNTAIGGASSGSGFFLQAPNDVSLVNCRANATVGRGFRIQTSARTQLVGCRATGSTGGNGWGVQFDACTDTVVVGMVLNGNVSPSNTINGATFRDGFFGINPVAGPQAIAVAASDAATTQTLANSLRTAMLALGLGV